MRRARVLRHWVWIVGAGAAAFAIGSTLDPSRAFFHPGVDDEPVFETSVGSLDGAAYGRYLVSRFGSRHVEDLAFDFVLARECEARGILRSAPMLARSMAAQRVRSFGPQGVDPWLRARFTTEALRQLRVDALIGAERQVDESAMQALFDHRYGVGGVRAKVRQLLVSFQSTRARMDTTGVVPTDEIVAEEARTRIDALAARVRQGASLLDLMGETDDRSARWQFVKSSERASAGILPKYNYVRYGDAFAEAVRTLEVGEVSGVVRSDTGFHLIELLDRTITKREDVEAVLRHELGGGRASAVEVKALRDRLLEKYEYRAR